MIVVLPPKFLPLRSSDILQADFGGSITYNNGHPPKEIKALLSRARLAHYQQIRRSIVKEFYLSSVHLISQNKLGIGRISYF